jgi:ABC-type dipeptide/oligopeptide/nickel transport system permease component
MCSTTKNANVITKNFHCYTLKFALLAQTFQWPVAIQNGDLLAPRRQDRQVRMFNFFAAFARDIPSLVAALPR